MKNVGKQEMLGNVGHTGQIQAKQKHNQDEENQDERCNFDTEKLTTKVDTAKNYRCGRKKKQKKK